jgi:predicted ATPase/class 3 adenylate cyclase
VRAALPTGIVTFLFTDVEGSTKLLHELGAVGYAEALAEHRRVIRETCGRHGGVEVDTQGDAFFFAFPTAPGASSAAAEMTQALASGPIQVRIGLHTGTPLLTEEGYVGDDVHFAARVAAAAHGGQVIVSAAVAAFIEPSDKVSQGLELRDLGEHRLKDIEGPVSIYQLGDGSFPPLKTISNTNLPRPASSFVGREQELAEVISRLEAGARLLTLTGPGGSGKTRLALEAAATLVPDYKAGVFWVGLSILRDPTLVTETIAQTLGAKDGLVEHISERELLLLLDNLEQVIEVAPELSLLLRACPNLTLLVTSRELLRVQGEVEYPVPPLAEPEAVSLFCERAQTEPSEEISELCARLDNLPLAIELAAARAKALSPAQILARLSQRLDLLKGGRDADPRQQTLRATIEWSYDLLSSEEKRLFARVSVFAGGCTFEAAEEVAGADLDTLQSLVEKSLLRYSNERYWMLETTREYAVQRLDRSDKADELRRRHATYFLTVAQAKGVRDAFELHFDELRREHDNFRSALVTFQQSSDSAAELRLAQSLGRLWYRGGYLREGLAHLEEALGNTDDVSPAIACDAHSFASSIALTLGHLERAEFHAREELALARGRGGAQEAAQALIDLGGLACFRREFGEARRYLEAALEVARAGNDDRGVAAATGDLTEVALCQGDFDRAAELAGEAIELSRTRDWTVGMAVGLVNVALARLSQGRVADASMAIRDGAEMITAREFPRITAAWLEAAGAILSADGKGRPATGILGAAARLREDLGAELDPFEASLHDTVIERLRQAPGLDFEAALAEGGAMATPRAISLALESLD